MHNDATVLVDDEALYDICHSNANVGRPASANLNSLLTKIIFSMSASLRFDGGLNVDATEFQTNLVLYSFVHLTPCCHAPIISAEKACHEQAYVVEITMSVCEPDSIVFGCDPRLGKYMTCCLMYSSNAVPIETVHPILLPQRIRLHLRHHDGIQAATCRQRGNVTHGNLHPGVSSVFFNRPRMSVFFNSLAGNLISWQATGGVNSTLSADTFFSCSFFQRA